MFSYRIFADEFQRSQGTMYCNSNLGNLEGLFLVSQHRIS